MYRRRLDQVLEPDFVDDLDRLDLDEVRERRQLAHEVENELSYYRRLLHGRLDLLAFEQRRRNGTESRSLIEALPSILADEPPARDGQPRYVDTDLPSLPEVGRREIDALMEDDVLLKLDQIDDTGLAESMAAIETFVADLSEQRKQVQKVEDALSAEVTARYRAQTGDVRS